MKQKYQQSSEQNWLQKVQNSYRDTVPEKNPKVFNYDQNKYIRYFSKKIQSTKLGQD